MWFAKDSVNARQPAPTAENSVSVQNSLSDDDDPFVDKVVTTLDNTREMPISRPSSPTPAATPNHFNLESAAQTDAAIAIAIPVMLHKCKPIFKNGSSRCFGKVVPMHPDEISLDSTTTYDDFYRAASTKLIQRFGDESKISSLEDHACLYEITVEHDRDSPMCVTKEGWAEVLESMRIEVMFGRKLVLNLWFASFVEFEREERKWCKRLCCGL
ncbi:hypothetical protein DOTSEDRAFT_60513 [Dothistroma septosporum NZE10]|uniref:Uncharacterized protein n=1 Tax=Dothistroma septosporum (strain NZE10 / CBS 128990) TaxID=675120 RepID=N1Q139_DOTSN|nr:hypothetical protein DOTSEDRAFT_60513 [Dothistroma septosporum NZE10]